MGAWLDTVSARGLRPSCMAATLLGCPSQVPPRRVGPLTRYRARPVPERRQADAGAAHDQAAIKPCRLHQYAPRCATNAASSMFSGISPSSVIRERTEHLDVDLSIDRPIPVADGHCQVIAALQFQIGSTGLVQRP